MVDFLGNKVEVGDEVVFVSGANSDPRLEKGIVKKIYKNDNECTVNSKSHVYSNRIMKLATKELEG